MRKNIAYRSKLHFVLSLAATLTVCPSPLLDDAFLMMNRNKVPDFTPDGNACLFYRQDRMEAYSIKIEDGSVIFRDAFGTVDDFITRSLVITSTNGIEKHMVLLSHSGFLEPSSQESASNDTPSDDDIRIASRNEALLAKDALKDCAQTYPHL